MRRREFFATFGSAMAWSMAGHAQHHRPQITIGVLVGSSASASARYMSTLPDGLKDLGYVEGKEVVLIYRYADGDQKKLPDLARELLAYSPKLIVTATTAAAIEMRAASNTIPIVSATLTDAINLGVVKSDANVGGNVTGIRYNVNSLLGKQVQLCLEIVPQIKRLGFLRSVNNPASASLWKDAQDAANLSGVAIIAADVRSEVDLRPAFSLFSREQIEAVVVPGDATLLTFRRRIAELANEAILPTSAGFREYVEDGCLISYGIDLRAAYRRVAGYVDKILKGARVADLPIELPTKFELALNLKTAKALGTTIPQTLIALADEVIE